MKVATWHRSGSVLFNVPLRNQWKLRHQIKHFHWFHCVMLIKTFPDRCQVATFNWFQLFLKTIFFDRSFLKWPRSQPDSFIFRVFYDRSNSAKGFLEKWTSNPRALHPSTNFKNIRNVIRDAVHIHQFGAPQQVFLSFQTENNSEHTQTFCSLTWRRCVLATSSLGHHLFQKN